MCGAVCVRVCVCVCVCVGGWGGGLSSSHSRNPLNKINTIVAS